MALSPRSIFAASCCNTALGRNVALLKTHVVNKTYIKFYIIGDLLSCLDIHIIYMYSNIFGIIILQYKIKIN